jgi:succinate dehydrogenase / fumarate reductase, cytochrome b subunit
MAAAHDFWPPTTIPASSHIDWRQSMSRVTAFFHSTIGLKFLMAITGLIWVGFVIGHMVGNLKMYIGAAEINEYGHHLKEFGYPLMPKMAFLWIVRGVLLLALVAHVRSAILLTRRAQIARPVGYKMSQHSESTYASRSMRWGGFFLAIFIVLHFLHLTTGQLHPSFEEGQVYGNLVSGFSVVWVAILYLLAMIPLGMHLYHGVWSCLQTLGCSHPQYNQLRKRVAVAVALIVVAGNISFPLAVLAGIVQ